MLKPLQQVAPLPLVGSNNLSRTTDTSPGRVAIRCVLALLVVTGFGTAGFLLTEKDWGLWESLYFTLTTITTVGYGDEGLSSGGQKFAAVLLLVGIGTATYSLSVLVQVAVSCQLAWKRKMQQRINNLRDHIVVCGFGRMGKTICERLTAGGVDFVVVEQNELELQASLDHGYPTISGNATEEETLVRAGASRARGVVCVVNSDAENIYITLHARDLNKDAFIVCRAETEGAAGKVQRAGASLVVSPHYSASVDIATAIIQPHLAEFLRNGRFADGNFELNEVTVAQNSPLAGQTVRQFGESERSIVFVAIERPDGRRIVRPGGTEQFHAGDVLIVAGDPQDLLRMCQAAQAV